MKLLLVKSRGGKTGEIEGSLGPEKKKYMSTSYILRVSIILAFQDVY